MGETVRFEPVENYIIRQAVCFENGEGFALAYNANSLQPWITWRFIDKNGVKDMFWGHPNSRERSAVKDYLGRIEQYKRDYPVLTEKYNYLAAAEMGEEQNYNAIDGIINNVQKPSILEHLRQYKPQPPDRGEKADRSADIEK